MDRVTACEGIVKVAEPDVVLKGIGEPMVAPLASFNTKFLPATVVASEAVTVIEEFSTA